MANPARVKALVTKIENYAEGIYLVQFQTEPRYNRYLPGQFLHLTLDEFDPTIGFWPESRVFSIAAEPRQDFVTIVYSVKGVYTKRMERELSLGKEVWLKYPYGSFTMDPSEGNGAPLVLVAGGTGVAPYLPFLLKAKKSGSISPIHLYYGLREPEHLLFRSEFEGLIKDSDFLRFRVYLEKGLVSGFDCRSGRLNVEDFKKDLGSDFGQAIFYLSGPPTMIDHFKERLISFDIKDDKIKIDAWE